MTGDELGGDTRRRQGEEEGGRLGEREADPRRDAVGAAEEPLLVAMVDVQVDEGADEHRQHQQQSDRGDERRPREERDSAHPHPGSARGEHRRRHGQGRGGEPDDSQGEPGEEQVDHLGVATARSAVVGERHDHDRDPADPGPEPGHRQAREGERPCAELQRDDGHRDPEEDGHQHPVEQTDPEGDEELGQGVGVEECVGAVDALDAQQHADGDARHQREERGADEQPADHLVVARREHCGRRRNEVPGLVGAGVRALRCRDRVRARVDGAHG